MNPELRSPLNAIFGPAQLESTSPLPTASQNDNIGHILWAGRHLLESINEVLDRAVIESGTWSISFKLWGHIFYVVLTSFYMVLTNPGPSAR